MTRSANAFFVVIEGLDGSGKTQVSRALASMLRRAYGADAALTFEPHDPSTAGLYIRQVLTKRIQNVQPRTLALAFALNRADHLERVIEPFLNGGERRVLLCDRYYLSSLVYQSVPPLTMADVWRLNAGSRRPDLTLFLDASPQTCYERMGKRPADRELFERNLGETRQKYETAIAMLRADGETVVTIDANPPFDAVLRAAAEQLEARGPDWLRLESVRDAPPSSPAESLNGLNAAGDVASAFVNRLRDAWSRRGTYQTSNLRAVVESELDQLSGADLAMVFFGALQTVGYRVGERLAWPGLDAYRLDIDLPAGLTQRGAALVLAPSQTYEQVTRTVQTLLDQAGGQRLFDYLIVLDAAPSGPPIREYERDIVGGMLAPSVRVIRRADLAGLLLPRITTAPADPTRSR